MPQYRFAAYRLLEFPEESKAALQQISEVLLPQRDVIVDKWVELQCDTWEPPGVSRDQLREMFAGLFEGMLLSMSTGQLEHGIDELEQAGTDLAQRKFPYEALVISLHFLEESYMPFLLSSPAEKTQEWLIRMDEFLHVAFAAIASSYFDFQRTELLQEVEVGRIVQAGMLSKIPKQLLDIQVGYVYASATERARVGGDFLDAFMLDTGRAAFIIGDLSGHGMEAASDAVMVRSLFRGFMRDCGDLSDTMTRLNHVLMPEFDFEHFATALAYTYDSSGLLRWVNAGHPPPIVCPGADEPVVLGDAPLAVSSAPSYSQNSIPFPPGSLFVAYTDGLSEARRDGDLFGEDRIRDAVAQVRNAPPRSVAEHLLDKAIRHAEGRLQDDIAILVLKRRLS